MGAGQCLAWVPNSAVVRLERTVEISTQETEAVVRVRSSLRNTSSAPQKVRAWMPVAAGAVEMKAYLDAEGIELHEFTERARLDALADAAESWSDVRFFRMAGEPWAGVYRTVEFEIPGETTRELIWQYNQAVQTQGGFQGIEVFLDDGVKDELFQVEFSLGQTTPIKHFWSPMLAESVLERSEYGVVAIAQKREFTPNANLRVIWSSEENPAMSFYSAGHEYRGHATQLSPAKKFENVTLVLDGTGSMSDIWAHVQELVRFLLENQLEKKFRVILVGDGSAEWLVGNPDEFVENTSQVRQKILEAVAWRAPLGKANLSGTLTAVGQPEENHLVIVFSDADDVVPTADSAPVAVLHFDTESGVFPWRKIAAATRGFVQRAYRSVIGTKEAADLLSSVESIREPILASGITLAENEVELSPSQLVPQSDVISPVFVGRIKTEIQSNVGRSWFDWLPRTWAAARLSEMLERGELAREFSTNDLDAMLAIGRTFGVQTELFSAETTRSELIENLTTTDDVWLAVQKLWKTSTEPLLENLRIVSGIPLWMESDEVWREYNFLDRVDDDRWVQIAPFSAAQRQLFVLFPEVFAAAFGTGENLDFCTNFRCFSVMPGARVGALPSDRAFLRDFNPNHWALPYVIELVNAEILHAEANGKLHLDRAITRGEFAKMLVLDRYGEGFDRVTEIRGFEDFAKGDIGYDAVQFLVAKGVIRGFPDGTFRPKQDLTRAEAVKILLAEEGFTPFEIEAGETPVFADSVAWERGWVEEAVRQGIVNGYSDGTFKPSKPLTRAEASKVIVEGR